MTFPLSPQSIDAIAEIISGGGGNDPEPPIGIYRSGPKIEKFMRACNVSFTLDGSRVPSLVTCLINLNNGTEVKQGPIGRFVRRITLSENFGRTSMFV
jgi:hypothetical protein